MSDKLSFPSSIEIIESITYWSDNSWILIPPTPQVAALFKAVEIAILDK